jgi:Predicted nucleotide-binding protein containing TIR-like domain
MDKLHILICSSKKSLPVAEGVKRNLERPFVADLWTEDFFNENNVTALNTFLKKLIRFDAVVIVMGPDDVQLDAATKQEIYVPRDNVIFEMGAAMARVGTRKTFVLAPDEPPVKLPTYLKGLDPLTYQQREDKNFVSATGSACTQIREAIGRLEQDAFHSDLPAVGLAYGYFNNFIHPLYSSLRERKCIELSDSDKCWELKDGFAITVLMPESVMSRDAADQILVDDLGASNVAVKLKEGRDMTVYLMPRTQNNSPLQIVDIPTTLLTSSEVIARMDSYWGAGDREFKEALTRREIAAFGRRVRGLVAEKQLRSGFVSVLPLAEFIASGKSEG